MSTSGNSSVPPVIHVTPLGPNAWAVRTPDEGQPLSEHRDRQAALAAGREMARRLHAQLVIFDERWNEQSRHAFDPE